MPSRDDGSTRWCSEGDIRERLVADITQFFDRRRWYADMGIPWRRGYLFFGPPGTGKTSRVCAGGRAAKLSLCTPSPTNPKLDDQSIGDLLQRTPAKSLILIEDVDAFVARDQQDQRIEVSFVRLLQRARWRAAQEGASWCSPNHRDSPDAALIRPGRIDPAHWRSGLPGRSRCARRSCFHPDARALADELAAALGTRRLSPASVQQVLAHAYADAREAVARLGDITAA